MPGKSIEESSFEGAVIALQSVCCHEKISERIETIEGNEFTIRQCLNCGMFNPKVREDLGQ